MDNDMVLVIFLNIKGTLHLSNGDQYIGEWQNNMRNGKGIL